MSQAVSARRRIGEDRDRRVPLPVRRLAVGWLVGVTVGLALALQMQRFRLAEAAVLPWIILSQTVPLIALAPLVRRWGSQIQVGAFTWESWMSAALIASYLAFFPVSVGALRGLGSPDANHVDRGEVAT